jgi:hypothetical protein
MYFCLVVALAATFFWVNIMFAEYISSKINPYGNGLDTVDKDKARIKNILVIIMALFWAAVFQWS